MLLTPDAPIGQPSFQLSADEIATVVDLACRSAHEGRNQVHSGMLEVPITIVIRKAMRRLKKAEGITNLQIRGEHELEDMATADPALLGRIDITLQFLRQFGDEDDYVAVECKRVGAGHATLNARYVSEGVDRFVTGQYSKGHAWAFMLAHVLALPVDQPISTINDRICQAYGQQAKLAAVSTHAQALAILSGSLVQCGAHIIRLQHIFVDMVSAAQNQREPMARA
jgi:hypothetical protein